MTFVEGADMLASVEEEFAAVSVSVSVSVSVAATARLVLFDDAGKEDERCLRCNNGNGDVVDVGGGCHCWGCYCSLE
jgi:hypothetical protein